MANIADEINKLAEKNDFKIESYEKDKVWNIENDYNKGRIDDAEAEKKLRVLFKYKIKDWEYRGIIKKVI